MALDASDPKDVALVSLDGKNAFGAMSRRKVAKAVATEFPEMWPWFRLNYGSPSAVYYVGDQLYDGR